MSCPGGCNGAAIMGVELICTCSNALKSSRSAVDSLAAVSGSRTSEICNLVPLNVIRIIKENLFSFALVSESIMSLRSFNNTGPDSRQNKSQWCTVLYVQALVISLNFGLSTPPGGSMHHTFKLGNFLRRCKDNAAATPAPKECPVKTKSQPRQSAALLGSGALSADGCSPKIVCSKIRFAFRSERIKLVARKTPECT